MLVRYGEKDGSTFLVGPGGGVHVKEGLPKAAVREVREETGLTVDPFPPRVLFVEEFLSRKYRHVKIWLLCSLVGGELTKTLGAKKEGIVEVGWYRQEELTGEVVYPSTLMTIDWHDFLTKTWESRYLELHDASF